MKKGGELVLRCSCATRCGDREYNEDNFRFGSMIEVTEPLGPIYAETSIWMDQTQVFCVCDGIGGSARGELASRRALKALSRFLGRKHIGQMPMEELAAAAAEAAHSAVLDLYRRLGLKGGCTMVMAILRGECYTIANIGDSPAYLYEGATRQLKELTVSHSLGWLARQTGKPCPGGMEHQLACYLGKEGAMAQDMLHMVHGTLTGEDMLMLCSDGVSNGIPGEKLKKYIKQGHNAAYIVQKASERPGSDNCTAICLYPQRLK